MTSGYHSTRYSFLRFCRLGCAIVVLSSLGGARAQQNLSPNVDTKVTLKPQNGVAPVFATEDLSSLVLHPGALRPAAPIFGERDNYPEFSRELIQVQWRSGDPIDLYVIRPTGIAKPPAVLYIYSYPSEADRFRDNEYCKRVTAGGYAAVGFVSALTGARYHDRPMKEWFVSQLPEALTNSVHDVQMILDYMVSRGDIDMGRIGMFGQGSGATIAILTATVDPRIRAVDTIQPWGDWPIWLKTSSLIPEGERSTYLASPFLAALASLDPIYAIAHVQTTRLRLQFVSDDTITVQQVATDITAAAPPRAEVIEYRKKQDQRNALSGGHVFDWIKEEVLQVQPQNQRIEEESK